MRVKTGAVLWGMHPEITHIMRDGGELDEAFNEHAGRDCIITSGRNGKHRGRGHKDGSFHYSGRAIDVRTNDIPKAPTRKILADLKRALDVKFDIVLEGEGTANEHLHIEFDPK